MKKLLFLLFMLISPAIFAGFPEGKNGYDLEKLEKSFRLPCDEIGNDDCLVEYLVLEHALGYLELKMGKTQVML